MTDCQNTINLHEQVATTTRNEKEEDDTSVMEHLVNATQTNETQTKATQTNETQSNEPQTTNSKKGKQP